MNAAIFNALIYLLGFMGLASVGLLPLRSWQLLRGVFSGGLREIKRKAIAAFSILVTVVVVWSDVQITARIFRCLTETYCGPNIASGWIYLAMLGAVYLMFEAVFFTINKFGFGVTAENKNLI